MQVVGILVDIQLVVVEDIAEELLDLVEHRVEADHTLPCFQVDSDQMGEGEQSLFKALAF